MNLLHILPTVNEAYGGPVAALRGMEAVGRTQGITRTVASLDLPQDPWVRQSPFDTVALGSTAVRRGRAALPWLRYGFTPHLAPWLRRHAGRFDRVVVHGLWNYAALAGRRVLPRGPTPYFVFPHGMLDPWFRAAHPVKHCAKQVAWWLAEGPLLHHAHAVLFTSEAERQAAAGAFRPYRLRGVVAGYGTGDAPPASAAQRAAFAARVPNLGGAPYLLFLGRIHPKKGCDLLLDAFSAQRGLWPEHHLVLAGPDTGTWGAGLRSQASALGLAGRVHWPGMLADDAKWGALHGCEAFVLPSHGENFGVAVAEALACGRPVLLSHKVNIVADVIGAGAGLAAPDTADGAADLLASFAALDSAARARMGERGRALFLDRFLAAAVASRLHAILADPEPFL